MELDDDLDFSQVLKSLKSGAKNKRDPRAIRLSAVTAAILDVIDGNGSSSSSKNNNDAPSAAQVFAQVVPALEGTLANDSQTLAESAPTQVALLELLAQTVPHVTPLAIVEATLPATSRVLRGSIVVAATSTSSGSDVRETKDELGAANASMRWTCKVATEILRRIGTTADEKMVRQLVSDVLVSTFRDRRPKVRKAAQLGVVELLRMESNGHPAISKVVSSYVRAELKAGQKLLETGGDASLPTELLHFFGFLENSLPFLKNYAKIAQDVMKIITILLEKAAIRMTDDHHYVAAGIQENTPKILALGNTLSVIVGLMNGSSAEEQNDSMSEFLQQFAPRALATLLQGNPGLVLRMGHADTEILGRVRVIYGECILACLGPVMMGPNDVAVKLLPLSIQTVLLLAKPEEDNANGGFEKGISVGQSLLGAQTQLLRERIPAFASSGGDGVGACLNACLQALQQVMQPIYQPVWSEGLRCLVGLISQISDSPNVPEVVERMVQLRNQSSAGSPAQHAVEDALSTLVQATGIEACWSWIRWNPDGRGVDVERAWIIGVMKSSASIGTYSRQNQNLSFFQNSVLGLARDCDRLAASHPKQAGFYRTQVTELWSLFPLLCKTADDIPSALAGALQGILAKALGDDRYPQLLVIITGGLANAAAHIEELEDQQQSAAKTAMSTTAVQLLPLLFKIVSTRVAVTDQGNEQQLNSIKDSHAVSRSIAALAKFVPPDFLFGLFKKLMQKLLEEADSNGVERICALLSLSQALVASRVLDDKAVSFLYRVLKPMLLADAMETRVQKRAYKVLAELCECHHAYFTDMDRMKDLLSMLSSSSLTTQVSARHMRLKCLNILVDGFDDSHDELLEEVLKNLHEILISLKDSNGKNREAGYHLLLSIAARKNRQDFLRSLTAALGAETSHMRSAAVMALSRVVYEFAWEDESIQEVLPSLLSTVLVLIDENSREVIKSTIGFIRICVAAIQKDQLEPLLPELVSKILEYQKAKSRFRSKIKIIIKRLVRMFGYEMLLEFVPQSETRLITHMRKLDEREARKKSVSKQDRLNAMEDFDAMLDEDEIDSDDGRTLMTGATGLTKLTRRKGEKSLAATRKTSMTATTKSQRIQLSHENEGEPVDMLALGNSANDRYAGDSSSDDSSMGAMEFDDEGRLVIREDDEPDEPTLELSSALEKGSKRRRVNREEHASVKHSSEKSTNRSKRALGASYRSKKAGGDVKRKNQKFEPYAFVPLDGKSYSKKNRRNAVEQMSSVVRQGGKRKR